MIDQARQEFALVHPRAAKLFDALDDEKLGRLLTFLDSGYSLVDEMNEHRWRDLGARTVRAIDSAVKEHIGDLSDKGRAKLLHTFDSLLRSDQDFFERYQAGDPQLVTDFVTEYKQDVLDPYHTSRASAAASTVSRARTLPRGGASSTVIPAGQGGEPALDANDPDAIHRRSFQRMRARMASAA
jgi:hypothetical protein